MLFLYVVGGNPICRLFVFGATVRKGNYSVKDYMNMPLKDLMATYDDETKFDDTKSIGGDQIKQFRTRHCMSQIDLAGCLGKGRYYIGEVEEGKKPIPKWLKYALVGLDAEIKNQRNKRNERPKPSKGNLET